VLTGWRNILDKGDAFYTDSHGQVLALRLALKKDKNKGSAQPLLYYYQL
jgi:hypothetical protein